MANTKYFHNCLGIFQGGGCKALAYIGAFREADSRGVFFSEVAGTSAGSIFAALIAAGATPSYLEDAVSQVDFLSLLQEPEDIGFFKRILIRLFAIMNTARVLRYILGHGLYSSKGLEEWMDKELRALTGKEGGDPVTFRDLNIPLHVVCTDTVLRKGKVWSLKNTPEESVAYAVRCSCSIPVFFQPVERRYVDGGLVSNLPSFIGSDEGVQHYQRILCFAIKNDVDEDVGRSVLAYTKRLVLSAIDGAARIQDGLASGVHKIEVGNLPIKTTDFDKVSPEVVSKMIEIGGAAAKEFFDEEKIRLKDAYHPRPIFNGHYEMLHQIVQETDSSLKRVIFCVKDLSYVYKIFPSLLGWRIFGTKICFWVEPSALMSDDKKEHYKLQKFILGCLGASVVESTSLPYRGVFFDYRDKGASAYLIRPDGDEGYFSVKYSRLYDEIAIAGLMRMLPSFDDVDQPRIIFSGVSEGDVIKKISNVEQYKNKNIYLSEVDVSKILFITRIIKSYKYSQISRLFSEYEKAGVEPFSPAKIQYLSSSGIVSMLVAPPVVEKVGDSYLVVEGNSRLTYLIRHMKRKVVKVVVVEGVDAALPASGRFFHKALIVSDKDGQGEGRYDGFKFPNFRWIEKAVRNPADFVGIK